MIIDTGGPRPRVIGEVDLFAAPTLVHENAIYLHESRQYHVDRLEWGERKAYVHPIDVEHYTQAELAVTLKPLEIFDSGPSAGRRARPRRGDGQHARHHLQEAASSRRTRTSAGARSTCPRRSSRPPPGGSAWSRGGGELAPGRARSWRWWAPAGRSRPWPASC